MSLPQPDQKVQCTYVWIGGFKKTVSLWLQCLDGTGEQLRSKTKTVGFVPKHPKGKIWNLNLLIDSNILVGLIWRKLDIFHFQSFHHGTMTVAVPTRYVCLVRFQKLSFNRRWKLFQSIKALFNEIFFCLKAEGSNTDVYLQPVALYKDPFRWQR